jgi:hypothetical protein
MIELYQGFAITCFFLSGVLIIGAIVIFIRCDIVGVRDFLSGRAVSRSIVQTREKNQTKIRKPSETAKRLGWNKALSANDLSVLDDANKVTTMLDGEEESEAQTAIIACSK